MGISTIVENLGYYFKKSCTAKSDKTPITEYITVNDFSMSQSSLQQSRTFDYELHAKVT